MERWGYTADNRSRAPREISTDVFPERLARVLRERGAKIFTNLSPDELKLFLRRLPSGVYHCPDGDGINASFIYYSDPETHIRKTAPSRQQVIEIIKGADFVAASLEEYDRECFNFQNPLGHSSFSSSRLFNVRI